MSAVVAQRITTSRPNIAQRWERASERARVANVQVTPVDDLGTCRVTSASYPGVSYESDGIHCTCAAYANGDPVCLHRAAVRDHIAAQKVRCPVCNGTGIEYISVWDWRSGCAVTVAQMPCSCTSDADPEPKPPAPPVVLVPTKREQELADAQAVLDKIDELLVPFNRDMEYGNGSYCQRNSHKHGALLVRREFAQRRVWETEDALKAAKYGQVAA